MMKRKIGILSCAMLLMFFGNMQEAYSSHVVGGELNYRCIGNRTFEVTLVVYRDCFFGDPLATFDNPAWLGIFSPDGILQTSQGAGGILFTEVPPPIGDTLRETLTSECFVEGYPVCVERAIYRDIVQLAPRADGYILVYQRCCRNETILNITEPDQTGAAFWAYIPPSALSQTECNSNPVFNDYPPIFVCTNEDVDFDHSATDFDGDEIVYELTASSRALNIDNFQVEQFDDFDEPTGFPIPFELVTFQAPFTLSNLFGGDTPLTIDAQTGRLTGIPTTVGQFLVGVSAKEYRDGVFLSETRRDFQYNVRNCGERPIASFTPDGFNCESLEVEFINTGTGNTFEWSFGDGSTSTEMSPTHTYTEPGAYEVELVAFISDACSDVFTQTFVVNNIIAGDLIAAEQINLCEGITSVVANVQTQGEVTVEWSLDPDFTTIEFTGIEYNVTGLVEDGTIYVRLTDGNGCVVEDQASIFVSSTVPAPFTSSTTECGSFTVNFTSTSDDLVGISWDFGDPLTEDDISSEQNPSYTYTSAGIYSVTLSGTSGLCNALTIKDVGVLGNNIISLSTVEGCIGDTVMLNEGGSDVFNYEWRPSEGLDQTDIPSPSVVVVGPMMYFVTISDPNDPSCSFEDTVNVALQTFGFDQSDQEFCPGVPVVLNPNGNQDAIYEWTPATGLDQTNIASPTATVDEEITYNVTITDADDSTCTFSGTINLVPMDFGFNASDAYACFGSPAILNAGGRADLVYIWSPAEGLDRTDIPSPSASVTENTTYNVTVSLPNSPECQLMTSVDVIFVDEPYDVDIDMDAIQCPGQSVTLSLIDNDARPDLTYAWYDQNFTEPPLSTGTSVSVQVSEPSTFFAVVSIGGNCPDTTEVNVTIDSSFEVSVAILNDRIFCPGDQVTAELTSDLPDGGTIQWSPPAVGTDVSTTFEAPNSAETNIVATVTSAAGCPSSAMAPLTVSIFPLTAIASPGCIMETTDIQLSATPGAVSYSWVANPVTEILDPTSANTTAPQVDETTMFTVTIVDENGCTFEATTMVSFQDDCSCMNNGDYPNYFTPNGDDINDIFEINYGAITFISMMIYDRWGNEVFSTTSMNDFWDGTSGGSEKPQDVYGYILTGTCPDQSPLVVGGNVTIFR